MTILDYIKKYGDYTFLEKEFNEVDNVIFSVLTYVNFDSIISKNKKLKKTINAVANEYFLKHPKKENKKIISSKKNGLKILDAIKNKRRYKDLLLYNYLYIGSENQQFSALTIRINKSTIYISFEGTDGLISGWEEDAKMTYLFPVEAQKNAIKYLNGYSATKDKIILGGHSKGGNLALVSAMYCTSSIKNRILKIYNNDGPGLRLKQIESYRYKLVNKKLIHLIPNYSVVGLLLRHKKYIVIKSNKKSILAHNPLTWIVKNNTFERTELSKFSLVLDESISKWLNKYDDTIREKLVITLFDICRNIDLKDLVEIKKNKLLLIKLLISVKNINPEVKEIVRDLISMINICSKNYNKEIDAK